MHQSSAFTILTQHANGYIGVCECCQDFQVAYKTLLIIFREEELHNYFAWLLGNRHTRENFVPLPHGRDRVYASPHSNLFLVFNDTELDELASLYTETQLILEARKILLSNRMN